MKMFFYLFFTVSILALLPLISTADGQELLSSNQYPILNKPSKIELRGYDPEQLGDVDLVAEYRPNSATSYTAEVARSSQPGIWSFEPLDAGIVLLKAVQKKDVQRPAGKDNILKTIATREMSVCFNRTPWSGVFMMLFAGGILFGGIILSVQYALKTKVSP
ncbi:hypothetical protein ACFL27_21770 [candidate division CSSED10-310 bacterium]|uniref:Uncharacterized protein n=1 Tax=candidate division CSSED10-310 bacterium TaxID=2855610 RepID=A0ABV6Z2Z7_UNCC1